MINLVFSVKDQQQKQIAVMEKITRETLKLIRRERDEMESKSSSRNQSINQFLEFLVNIIIELKIYKIDWFGFLIVN